VFSLLVILLLGSMAILAPVIANDKPLFLKYKGENYYPALVELLGLQQAPILLRERFSDTQSFLSKAQGIEGTVVVMPPIPFSPKRSVLKDRYRKPGEANRWLGADDTGRDTAARIVHGARVSLTIGFVSMGISTILGLLIGSLCGWYGGWLDILLSRIMEVVEAVPLLLLLLILLAALDEPSLYTTMTIIGLTGWTGIARIFRGQVLRVRKMDYVSAAQALGSKLTFVLWRHVLPNAIAPVFVALTFGIASAILAESMLAFLGFSDPSYPTWGEIIEQGRNHTASWHLIVFPGVAIFMTVTAFNLLGDALRDAIDPKMNMK
jgi:peptide/nickel transport system permease protein